MTAGQHDECDEIAKLVRSLYPDAHVAVGYINRNATERYLSVGVWLPSDLDGKPLDFDGQMHGSYTDACAFWTTKAAAWHRLSRLIDECPLIGDDLDDDTYRADDVNAWGEIGD